MDELEQLLTDAIEKFRGKIAEDEALQNELADITRTVTIDILEKDGFSFILDKGEIKDFKHGHISEPDVALMATEEDFIALMKGELKPMKAWATKRLKFKASLSDVMRLKKFF